jgi:hypothetical protein
MPEPPPTPELLRSLGGLVRGLSILFWGLPLALLVCVGTASGDFLRTLNVAPPVFVLGWLLYGLIQLGEFQKQERIWRAALDRAKMVALINIGLGPFLYWWSQSPDHPFFTCVVVVLAASGLIFISELNVVLARLTAMLPEETLRQDTKQFTTLNRILILCAFVFALCCASLLLIARKNFGLELDQLPSFVEMFLRVQSAKSILPRIILALAVFLLLSPLAITMALIWKTKEVVLESVFGGKS